MNPYWAESLTEGLERFQWVWDGIVLTAGDLAFLFLCSFGLFALLALPIAFWVAIKHQMTGN